MPPSEQSKTVAAENARGIAAMVAAMACFVSSDSFVKHLGHEMPLGEIIFARGLFASALVLVMVSMSGALRYLRHALSPLILLRSLAEIGATVLFYSALVRMAFADVNAIGQFTPMAITAGAALFFKEPVGWRRWLAALAGLIGVLVIIRPGTAAFHWAALFVVGSVTCVAARDLITRRLVSTVPTLCITLISAASVASSGLLLLPFETWQVPSAAQILLLAGAAVTTTGGYYWIIVAMRTGEIAVISPFRYAATLFAVVTGILVFAEFPDLPTLLGICIIVGAGLYTLHRERVRRRAATVNPPSP